MPRGQPWSFMALQCPRQAWAWHQASHFHLGKLSVVAVFMEKTSLQQPFSTFAALSFARCRFIL